jgi:hypothetical protein
LIGVSFSCKFDPKTGVRRGMILSETKYRDVTRADGAELDEPGDLGYKEASLPESGSDEEWEQDVD